MTYERGKRVSIALAPRHISGYWLMDCEFGFVIRRDDVFGLPSSDKAYNAHQSREEAEAYALDRGWVVCTLKADECSDLYKKEDYV